MKRGEIWLPGLDATHGHEQEDGVALDNAGTRTTGVVRCDQPRALDLRARGGKKLERVPDAVMNEVLARILPILE